MPDDSNRLLAALCYVLWPVALILLVVQETKVRQDRDKYLRHHAYNAAGFALALVLISVVSSIIFWMPFVGTFFALVSWVLWLIIVIVAIFYAMQTYRGEDPNIPLVTELLAKMVTDF